MCRIRMRGSPHCVSRFDSKWVEVYDTEMTMDSLAPRISVVIPLYNQCESIQRTVESVACQGYANFEIIVVDDGSTDGGGYVVAGLNISPLRLIRQENSGVSTARNRGIAEALGSIVAFLDADDEWRPDFLESIVELADSYPACSVYATSYVIRDAEGREQLPLMNGFPSTDASFVFHRYFEIASVSSPPIWTGAIAARKEALEHIGGFPEDVRSGEDLVTWAWLYAEFEIAYLPLPKSVYLKDNFSWKHDKRLPEMPDRAGMGLQAILANPDVAAEKKIGLRRYLGLWKKIRASHWIALGNRGQALVSICQSIRYYPWNVKVWLYIPFVLLPSGIRDTLIGVAERNTDQSKGRI